MSIVVTLSYEEKIINALRRLPVKREMGSIEYDRLKFDTIRSILRPLYEQLEQLNWFRENPEGTYEDYCQEQRCKE